MARRGAMTRRSDKPERPSRSQKQKPEVRGAKKAADGADELPTLEPMDAEELPVLEAVEEVAPEPTFPVRVVSTQSSEAGFDLSIAIEVPEMDKKTMADAVAAPLQHALASGKAKARHQRVVVSFSGDAIIGSAVKERCAQLFTEQKARKVVLRRGYGDETLFEREAPRAQVTTTRDGKKLAVTVDTGELEAQDLAVAMQVDLVQLAAQANGARVTFTFRGTNKPDAALRSLVEQMLRDSGALAAAIGQRVLFDRELEDRVRIEVTGDAVTIRVAPAERDADTEEALAMRLSSLGEQVRGKIVKLAFATQESEGVRSATVRYCTQGGPQRVEIARSNKTEVVWPSLLTVSESGGETVLTVTENGRDRAAVLAAFFAEARDFAPVVAGKKVVVQWPANSPVDEDVESACLSTLVALTATRVAVACGAERIALHPAPIALSADGAVQVLRVDTESGKPAELLRAFERWQKKHGASLRGALVRIAFAGEVAPSRTLQRSLTEAALAQQPNRLSIDIGGRADVVFPPFVRVGGNAASGFVLAADASGRDEAQQKTALEREFAAITGLAGAKVTVETSTHADELTAAAIAAGAMSVVCGGVQVHPALLSASRGKGSVQIAVGAASDVAMAQRQIARELPKLFADGALSGQAVTVAWAGADAAVEPCASLVCELVARGASVVRVDDGAGKIVQAHPQVVREFVRVLGKKDDAVPPIAMLGISLDEAEDQPQQVAQALAAMSGVLAGRRVLLVGLQDGAEVPFLGSSPVVTAARGAVDAHAAATLCFRGKDANGVGCFGVARSSVEGLAFGQNFRDPRG
jgi:hypothetical protein